MTTTSSRARAGTERTWAGLALCASLSAAPLACRTAGALPLGDGSRATSGEGESLPYDAVSLVLPTADGRHVDLADHRGKALLVVAFTTENLACQAMLRDLERLARAHPQDLAVVAVAGDEQPEGVLRQMLLAYRDVLALERVELTVATPSVRDGTSPLGRIERVPTVFFFNRAGVVVRRLETVAGYAQLERLIAPALPPRP